MGALAPAFLSLMSNPPPVNVMTELAKERNRGAAERTLMAWIRTCLALISFGFGLDRIVAAIARAGNQVDSLWLSRLLGLAFIALGVYAMLMAVLEHRRELRRIQREEYRYSARRSLSLTVAIALIAIGLFAFVGILLKAIF
jgi:putative membrane protein